MSWLNWLENRVGFLAIPRLIPAIALLNLFVFILVPFERDFVSYLTLEPALVLQGQVWRLVSYIFIPPYALDNHGGPLLPAHLVVPFTWFITLLGDLPGH